MVNRFDYLGNTVTADSDAVVAGMDDFIGGLLGYETRVGNVLQAADAEPECCLANAYAGMLWMLTESQKSIPRAARYLARAEQTSGSATRREALAVQFLDRWIADDIPASIAIADAVLADAPRDLLMVKLHQYHDFNLGDAGGMLRVATGVARHNDDIAQMHSMLAFGYEQDHQLEAAEKSARRAMSLLPRDPWAHHAIAHVMLTQGRITEGVEFMEEASTSWIGLTSFMSTHAWWHLALFYLSQKRLDDALDLYDHRCWGIEPDYAQDQIGAVSLLTRLEIAGVEVGDRWNELGGYLVARRTDALQPFNTLHYLLGLARAGRPEAAVLLAAIEAKAHTAPEFARAVWRDVAVPAAQGLTAYARGDHRLAETKLNAALPRLGEIGGSHAQRELFTQIHRHALSSRSESARL